MARQIDKDKALVRAGEDLNRMATVRTPPPPVGADGEYVAGGVLDQFLDLSALHRPGVSAFHRMKAVAKPTFRHIISFWIQMRRIMRKLCPSEMLERSVIVCAHPDDEVLWFSSILCQVDEIVICFMDFGSRPEITRGRARSLSEYPMRNVSSLWIAESEVFDHANYDTPVLMDYGMRVVEGSISAEKYESNFLEIKNALREKLKGFRNVITHNPWGEYGNEEHVQVYKAVKDLHEELGFEIWFSNYCSEKAMKLYEMTKFHCGKFMLKRTDKMIFLFLKKLYSTNMCWTWFHNWNGYNWEGLIRNNDNSDSRESSPNKCILNMIVW